MLFTLVDGDVATLAVAVNERVLVPAPLVGADAAASDHLPRVQELPGHGRPLARASGNHAPSPPPLRANLNRRRSVGGTELGAVLPRETHHHRFSSRRPKGS